MIDFIPRFTQYWDWSKEQIENEIAAQENFTKERLAKMSTADKQRRTVMLRTLRQELTSRVEWAAKIQVKAAAKTSTEKSSPTDRLIVCWRE